MKNVLSLCILMIGFTVNAQQFSAGVRIGLNFASETATGSGARISGLTKTSCLAGVYGKVMFSNSLGLQSEFFYSSLGTRSGENIEQLNYVSMPVMLRYHVTDNVHFMAGPQLNVLMTARNISDGKIVDIRNQFTDTDFSAAFGLGVDWGRLNTGLRYNLGLTNISRYAPTGFSIRNNAVQIVVGFRLFGK